MGWEHFHHGADIGIRGTGPTMAAAFAAAATALAAVMVDDPAAVPREEERRFELAAPDPETLLYDWLNRLISEMAVTKVLLAAFQVDIEPDGESGWRLRARAQGAKLTRLGQRPAVEVKGATFTALKVAPLADGGWVAEDVVDV